VYTRHHTTCPLHIFSFGPHTGHKTRPRPRALEAPYWRFCRRSGLRFGSKLGSEPVLGPVWPAQPAQRRPFSVFVLAEFSNFEKQKNLNTSARFSVGLFFSLFSPGPAGVRGPETSATRQNSKTHFPALKNTPLPADPPSPAFWGLLELKKLYGPRPRALGAPCWRFCRRSGLRFGSKPGPEPGTPPTGPRVARTTANGHHLTAKRSQIHGGCAHRPFSNGPVRVPHARAVLTVPPELAMPGPPCRVFLPRVSTFCLVGQF
jgi:hypothetical protein